jgi:RecJ-like exonuclease
MSHTSLAYRCDTDSDLTEITNLTVECYRCDTDNPLAVARSKCPDCKGTGRAPVQFAQIMSEIRESHAEQDKQMAAGSSEVYSDEDTFVD